MKFIRLATIAALSTTIFAGGFTAFAEETETNPQPEETSSSETRQAQTIGDIEFVPNTDEELVVVPPETDPDVEIEPEEPNTTGPLALVKAATMNFGTQLISNKDQVYNMVAERQQQAGTTGEANKVPYVSFAQVQDVRGSNAGWDLQVSLTPFLSGTQSTNNELKGVELEFVSGQLDYQGNTAGNAPSVHANNLILKPGNSVSVMEATTGKGAGVSSVVWGNQAELTRQANDPTVEVVTNEAIQLSIPGATAKDAGTYTATLTWELTTTPGPDAGGETPETPETPEAP